ncbi:hypothetical protein GCM10028799_24220 [Kribbella italica]
MKVCWYHTCLPSNEFFVFTNFKFPGTAAPGAAPAEPVADNPNPAASTPAATAATALRFVIFCPPMN